MRYQRADGGRALPGNIISFLLQQGVARATDVLRPTSRARPRDNCEKAGADTHDGTSRLDREAGPTFALSTRRLPAAIASIRTA